VNQAIVTDGLWRKSLSTIRALGKNGFDVTVMGDSIFTTGFWSRFTGKRLRCPTAKISEAQFGETLLSALRKFKAKPVLFPMEDETLLWVMKNREELASFADFLIPPEDSLLTAFDKGATIAIAEKLKLPHPKTWQPANIKEFSEVLKELHEQKIIVKPRHASGSKGLKKELKAEEAEAYWFKFGPPIVQEQIPQEGAGLGVSLLLDSKQNCLGSFVHRRLKEYPVTGGPSTDRVSMVNESLADQSLSLLKELSWVGIGMVEWKLDPRDGVPKLMEINPRFWGSLELAVRSGINFPLLYARAARRETVEPARTYKNNLRCRWLIPGDILRYFSDVNRESFFEFLNGIPKEIEEWDPMDVRGFFATIICSLALGLNPHYWKYIRRR